MSNWETRIVNARNREEARYYIRIADKLCTKCGGKRDNHTTKCQCCREKHSVYMMRQYRIKKGVSLEIPKQQGRKLCVNT